MSKITGKVASAVKRALEQYGDEIEIVDRNQNRYRLDAIARRPTFLVTGDATLSEYYFLVSAGDFQRVQASIGLDSAPAPFFGDETIHYNGEVYVLRKSEPWEWYDGTRQVVRLWGTKLK